MIKIRDYYLNATVFPDKTTQVWNIPEDLITPVVNVEWVYEGDYEIFQLIQLADLLNSRRSSVYLFVDFMPYSRQDKEVSNKTTFAFTTLKNLLGIYFDKVYTIDIHNPMSLKFSNIESALPISSIEKCIDEVKPDFIAFPDKGASKRGYPTKGVPTIFLEKTRNQSTGQIECIRSIGKVPHNGTVLIIDDICDGGRTFVEAAKFYKALGAESICLYTTHGIYSNGVDFLFKNGIDRIFNLKGEILNENK